MTAGVIAYQRAKFARYLPGQSAPGGQAMKPIALSLAAFAFAAFFVGMAEAAAQTPLGKNSYVTDRLVAARVADRIRKSCPTIGARLLYALGEAQALQNWTLEQGYKRDEVKAFLKDPAEKQKIYARAEAYLAKHGATPGNVEGFCALGHKEIAAKSIAGTLIYKK
jgi:hypothetical protein